MSDNTHIIQKQLIELKVPRDQNHFALTQRLENLLQDQLCKKLEPVFDQLAGPERWLEIDRIKIDLGQLNFKQNDQVWLAQAFPLFCQAIEAAPVENTTTISRFDRHADCLQYFLRFGYLPWWAPDMNLETATIELVKNQANTVLAFLAAPVACRRWVQQFSESLQQALLEALSIDLSLSLHDWQVAVQPQQRIDQGAWKAPSMQIENPTHQQLADLYWLTVWQAAAPPRQSFDQAAWKALLMQNLLEQEPQFLQDTGLRGRLENIGLSVDVEMESTVPQVQVDNKESLATDSEGIYVPLAGIVLAHPFLPALFEKVGLLNDGEFTDNAAQLRAVHLLYYIATQQQQPLESETVLLKVLSGLQPEAPIVRVIELTAAETTEAERMLQALIEHWPTIHGSSTEELRSTFFPREGKLSMADLGWQLTIEQAGFDVLLGQLPWGLSPIMHPWMDRMLWVDWA